MKRAVFLLSILTTGIAAVCHAALPKASHRSRIERRIPYEWKFDLPSDPVPGANTMTLMPAWPIQVRKVLKVRIDTSDVDQLDELYGEQFTICLQRPNWKECKRTDDRLSTLDFSKELGANFNSDIYTLFLTREQPKSSATLRLVIRVETDFTSKLPEN
jgi:hypothetical protein